MESTIRVDPSGVRHQPFKAIFVLYMVIRLLLALPWWVLSNLSQTRRPRPSWNMSRVLAIKSSHVMLNILFKTTSFDLLGCNPEVMALDDRNGLVWIEPKPDTLVDALKEAAQINGVGPARVAGYWYGKRNSAGKVGQLAETDEKVIYEILGESRLSV